jgi:hypothetical protein
MAVAALCLYAGLGVLWTAWRPLKWTDRRPIGALFLASDAHVSAGNPRGWFNDKELDVRGAAGIEKFGKAMLGYADRSIRILRETGSQGMIVWDLEGEEFPHKVTYIGDPRLATRLAPETANVVDEFFRRFRAAGLSVGVTIRPQQLTFNPNGKATQEQVWDYERLLIDKIDYARKRWGATLFYIDSNGGPRWPAEPFRLRRVAQLRPDVLLIPEHNDILYYGFSAPYGALRNGDSPTTRAVRSLYPDAFQVLAIADAKRSDSEITAAYRNGDVLLFLTWFDSSDTRLLTRLASER